MEPSREESLQAERDAKKVTDTKALPVLRAYRERLEKEAGALSKEAGSHNLRVGVILAAACLVAVYGFYKTLTVGAPVVVFVVAGVLTVIGAVLSAQWNKSQGTRRRHLEELHKKMLSAGQRIDGAERRLRE